MLLLQLQYFGHNYHGTTSSFTKLFIKQLKYVKTFNWKTNSD